MRTAFPVKIREFPNGIATRGTGILDLCCVSLSNQQEVLLLHLRFVWGANKLLVQDPWRETCGGLDDIRQALKWPKITLQAMRGLSGG